jgi:heptosyltransferase-3
MGPWPMGGLEQTWNPKGGIQHRGNVWIVQKPLPCLPCERLGCERHYESYSLCLDELSAEQVLLAVEQALGEGQTVPPHDRAPVGAGTSVC